MVISNSYVLHKIIDKYDLRYILAAKLSKLSSFIIYFENMHLIIFLGGGRKSFELPCILMPVYGPTLADHLSATVYKIFEFSKQFWVPH